MEEIKFDLEPLQAMLGACKGSGAFWEGCVGLGSLFWDSDLIFDQICEEPAKCHPFR